MSPLGLDMVDSARMLRLDDEQYFHTRRWTKVIQLIDDEHFL